MSVIFYFSSKTSIESDKQSDKVIDGFIIRIVKTINPDISDETLNIIYKYSVYPVRKYAHIIEFFILSIFVYLFINSYDISLNKIFVYSFFICFIYAISDEVHQLFVAGRSASIKDVLTDSLGSIIFLLICFLIKKRKCYKINLE